MSWDGKTDRRTNGLRDHDLLNQIDTKLTILLENFDKHMVDDKATFEKHDSRIGRLEKVYWVGIGVFIIVEGIIKFIK